MNCADLSTACGRNKNAAKEVVETAKLSCIFIAPASCAQISAIHVLYIQ